MTGVHFTGAGYTGRAWTKSPNECYRRCVGLTIAKTTGAAGETMLSLAGSIDEQADLTPLREVASGALVLDLGGVDRINSVGVREWIRALQAIPEAVTVTWVATSVALVSQLGMIANFHGRSRIRSFYAPYWCAACQAEQRFLLTPADVATAAPRFTCPRCAGPLELDELEADYFGGVRAVG